MRNIFIIAGHSEASPGATAYNGVSEHEYTKELRTLIQKNVNNAIGFVGTSEESDTDSNQQVRKMINSSCEPGDFGIDIHFNNNNPDATGTECIVSEKTSNENRNRASRIVQGISRVLDIPIRRRKPNRDYIFESETHVKKLGILSDTKCPMIIVEVCFLNERDLPKYLAKKNLVAAVIAKELVG